MALINLKIGDEGYFTFAEPYNTDDFNKKFKVIGIRSLSDLYYNEEDPLNNIYLHYNMTKQDYEEDIENDINIITLSSNGNKLTYIPQDRILSLPKTDGVEYIKRVITVNLGMLPKNINLQDIQSDIKDMVGDAIGVIPGVGLVNTSDSCYRSEEDHDAFLAKINTNPNVRSYKSYATKYKQLTKQYNALYEDYQKVQNFLYTNASTLIENTNIPSTDDLKLYTKKIEIQMISSDLATPIGLNHLRFIKNNRFNTTSNEIYFTGCKPTYTTGHEWTGLLNNIGFTMLLEEGSFENQHFPNVFGDTYGCQFKPGKVKFTITLDDAINLRGYYIRPWLNNKCYASQIMITLFNSNNTPILNNTLTYGSDYLREPSGTDSLYNKTFIPKEIVTTIKDLIGPSGEKD